MGRFESAGLIAARGLSAAASLLGRLVAAGSRARESRRVRAFRADAEAVGPLGPRRVGVRTVEVTRIVGSVGRSHELTADFRPRRRRDEDEHRFQRVFRAIEQGRALPLIELYQLGDAYYVVDGHHRVAAFRRVGQLDAEASVTAFVPLASAFVEGHAAQEPAFGHAARHEDVVPPCNSATAKPQRLDPGPSDAITAGPCLPGDGSHAWPLGSPRPLRRASNRPRGWSCSLHRGRVDTTRAAGWSRPRALATPASICIGRRRVTGPRAPDATGCLAIVGAMQAGARSPIPN